MRLIFLSLFFLVGLIMPQCYCQEPRAFILSGDFPLTHDPSIAREGDSYYVLPRPRMREMDSFLSAVRTT